MLHWDSLSRQALHTKHEIILWHHIHIVALYALYHIKWFATTCNIDLQAELRPILYVVANHFIWFWPTCGFGLFHSRGLDPWCRRREHAYSRRLVHFLQRDRRTWGGVWVSNSETGDWDDLLRTLVVCLLKRIPMILRNAEVHGHEARIDSALFRSKT